MTLYRMVLQFDGIVKKFLACISSKETKCLLTVVGGGTWRLMEMMHLKASCFSLDEQLLETLEKAGVDKMDQTDRQLDGLLNIFHIVTSCNAIKCYSFYYFYNDFNYSISLYHFTDFSFLLFRPRRPWRFCFSFLHAESIFFWKRRRGKTSIRWWAVTSDIHSKRARKREWMRREMMSKSRRSVTLSVKWDLQKWNVSY